MSWASRLSLHNQGQSQMAYVSETGSVVSCPSIMFGCNGIAELALLIRLSLSTLRHLNPCTPDLRGIVNPYYILYWGQEYEVYHLY